MFVIGGFNLDYKDEVEKIFFLNLKNETWSQVDKIIYQNLGHTANLIRNRIYLFGGSNITTYRNTNNLNIFSIDNKTCLTVND